MFIVEFLTCNYSDALLGGNIQLFFKAMHPALHGWQLSLHLTNTHRLSLLNPLTKVFHLEKEVKFISSLCVSVCLSVCLCLCLSVFLSLSHSPVSPVNSWSSQPWTGRTGAVIALLAWSPPAAEPCEPSPGQTHCSSVPPLGLPPMWRYGPQCDVSPQIRNCYSAQ